MFRKKSILIFLIIFLLNISSLYANEKLQIINSINNIETLKFDFVQISFEKEENGVCFLKRPHFLKCIYKNKNQKELIINKNNLVIYHKRYNKTYFFPVSKSYFVDILDKKKFENIILKGNLDLKDKFFEITFSEDNKGKITFFFHAGSFQLSGWQITDQNNNLTIFKINNLNHNEDLDKKLFDIPSTN